MLHVLVLYGTVLWISKYVFLSITYTANECMDGLVWKGIYPPISVTGALQPCLMAISLSNYISRSSDDDDVLASRKSFLDHAQCFWAVITLEQESAIHRLID